MDNNLFYCYSYKLRNYLVENGLNYLHKGFHDKTKKWFYVFNRTEELNNLLSEWSLNK